MSSFKTPYSPSEEKRIDQAAAALKAKQAKKAKDK